VADPQLSKLFPFKADTTLPNTNSYSLISALRVGLFVQFIQAYLAILALVTIYQLLQTPQLQK